MPSLPPQRPGTTPYRPALDGLRAVAVAAVIAFHVDPQALPGGWLGVDIFFVLSGFLITRILLLEHEAWGRIDLIGFWLRRARRLLPALALVLVAVLAAGAVWTVPARRGSLALDVAATLGYVANWRLLLGDEAYFASISDPSPLRHAWSLAVEEQFYLVLPLLLMALTRFGRRVRLVALGTLALLSAVWAAHLVAPGTDPVRAYYGTDARAQELLVGAVLAVLLHPLGRSSGRLVPDAVERAAQVLAWPAVAITGAALWWGRSASVLVVPGALAVFCSLVAVVVAVAASARSSVLQRAMGWAPLRAVGTISYGLYLWHWPVIVYLTAERTHLPRPLLVVSQVVLSVALATTSYLLVEKPVRRGGVRALLPARPRLSVSVAASAVPVLVIGTAALPLSDVETGTSGGGSATVQQAAYRPDRNAETILLMGNSVPASLAEHFPAGTYPDLTIAQTTSLGCDPMTAPKVLSGDVEPVSRDCVRWRTTWPRSIAQTRPDLAVLFLTQAMLDDHEVDGAVVRFDDPGYSTFLASELDRIRRVALGSGAARFAVVNLACHDVPDFGVSDEVTRMNDVGAVSRLNALAADWARGRDVPVVDQFGLLCRGGYHSRVNGVPLYEDWMHFSTESGPVFWGWLAPRLRTLAGGASTGAPTGSG